MQLKQKDIASALDRKGFLRRGGDHARFVYHTADGRVTERRTMLSHGSGGKPIRDPLLGEMARQCGLKKREFIYLVSCTLDRDSYERLLVERGHVEAVDESGATPDDEG